jgi:hypothetical protein
MKRLMGVGVAVGALAAAASVPLMATATNENKTFKAGLVTLCVTDAFVRVGGLNDSPRDVTMSAFEFDVNGKVVSVLGSNASDELKAIFPITIPADSKYAVTWDLPFPAHVNGVERGQEHQMHGSWNPGSWADENGLKYRGTGGTAGKNGGRCPAATTTVPTTTIAATTTTAPVTTVAPTTTPETTTTVAPTTTSAETTTTVAPSSTIPETTTTVAPTTTVVETTTTAVPTTTLPPAPTAEPIRPVAVKTTANSKTGAYAVDGQLNTAFTTQMLDGTPATWAWVRADLGKVVPLREVRWMWSVAGSADDFRVQTSTDAINWTVIGSSSDDATDRWHSLSASVEARYVRLYWRNPNRDAQIGNVAEMEFLALPTPEPQVAPAASATVNMTPIPSMVLPLSQSPLGAKVPVVASRRGSNSPEGSSKLTLDGDVTTAWSTSMSVKPSSGWVYFDLGEDAHIGRIRWKFLRTGAADMYRIQVSDDAVDWQTLVTHSGPGASDQWQTLLPEEDTRYVRFYFINSGLDDNIGYLSEVRFYAS